jgi:SAM-dependent methyltransferase
MDYQQALQAARQKAEQADYGSPFRYYSTRMIPECIRSFCPANAKILDLGCGSGRYAFFFVEAGIRGAYTGIDIDPRSLEGFELAEVFSSRLLVWDAHHLADLDETFDFIISVTAFEHFERDGEVLRGMRKAMAPGGHALIVVPSHYSYALYGTHGFRRYSRASIRGLASDAGFEVSRILPIGGLAGFLFHLWWFLPAHAIRLAGKALFFLLAGGSREDARKRWPGAFKFLNGMGDHHLKTGFGRKLHRMMLGLCATLDPFVPFLEVGYLAVLEKPSSAACE